MFMGVYPSKAPNFAFSRFDIWNIACYRSLPEALPPVPVSSILYRDSSASVGCAVTPPPSIPNAFAPAF